MFKTPILFLIFNRPEVTHKVFEEIKKQKPKFLFVAADGPRSNFQEDIEKCKICREIVLSNIDWDCEVKTLFRNYNLGCGRGVSQAISWFFENVEQGIILEDDCLPHPDFFSYCENLLNKYKDNENVYAISGNNFQNGIQRGNASYYFSNYVFVWGWASWRRAWKNYDFQMNELGAFKENNIINKIDNRKVFRNYWFSIFEKTSKKEIDTWDYQWLFTIWRNRGLSIVPNVNLISNIGFGEDATHTLEISPLASIPTMNLGRIIHPRKVRIDRKADSYATANVYCIGCHRKTKNSSKIFKAFFKKILKYLLPFKIITFAKKIKGKNSIEKTCH